MSSAVINKTPNINDFSSLSSFINPTVRSDLITQTNYFELLSFYSSNNVILLTNQAYACCLWPTASAAEPSLPFSLDSVGTVVLNPEFSLSVILLLLNAELFILKDLNAY